MFKIALVIVMLVWGAIKAYNNCNTTYDSDVGWSLTIGEDGLFGCIWLYLGSHFTIDWLRDKFRAKSPNNEAQ